MLKTYEVIRTNEHGETESNHVSVRLFNADYENQIVEVYFRRYATAEAQAEGSLPRPDFCMRVEGNDFLAAAMMPVIADELGLPFLFVFSNRIWDMALNAPFIEDYSEKDGNGKRTMTRKSLSDLNATQSEE